MERLTEKFKDGRNILRKGITDIFHVGFGRFFDGEAVDKLAEYEDLEEQGKLLKLPCAVEDFALFSDGDIRPVTYITVSNARDGIVVGCQNGINISMNLQYGSWCKGFFKTRPEAEQALKEMERKKNGE